MTTPPLTYTSDQAMGIIRSPTATAEMLEAALKAIDPSAAEAEIDRLEAERRQLLLRNASDRDIDFAEEKIKTACRALERLTAAKETLPARIVERRAREHRVNARADRAEQLAQQQLATLAEMHQHAAKITELLATLRQAEGEIRACNLDLNDLDPAARRVALPMEILQQHVGCSWNDLPQVDRWESLDGYGHGNRQHTLERAAELVAQRDPPSEPTPPPTPRRARSAAVRPTMPAAAEDLSRGATA